MDINNQIDIKKSKIYGYIYLAINTINGKVYIGKFECPKTIEERWIEHLREGKNLKELRELKSNKKIWDTHLNNAIAKYGETIWELNYIDKAYTKEELNKKERYWIKKYDAMNRNKGYNMTEGGDGGKLRPELVEKIKKKIIAKWEDPKYKQRQSNGLKIKWQDPKYKKVMTESAKIRSNNSIYIKKLSEAKKKDWKNINYRKNKIKSVRLRWQDNEFKEKVRKSLSKTFKIKWQDPKYRKKQLELPQYQKKKVDKREFLNDLKNCKLKEIIEKKYRMSHHTINKRIKEILGKFGIKNYTEAKNFLKNINIDKFLNEID